MFLELQALTLILFMFETKGSGNFPIFSRCWIHVQILRWQVLPSWKCPDRSEASNVYFRRMPSSLFKKYWLPRVKLLRQVIQICSFIKKESAKQHIYQCLNLLSVFLNVLCVQMVDGLPTILIVVFFMKNSLVSKLHKR